MSRLSPVTWLVVVAAVLICALVASTLLVERATRRLNVRAAEIVDNAAPSIAELAAAGTGMRKLEVGVGRYLTARAAGLPRSVKPLEQARAKIDAHLMRQERVPFFIDEPELNVELQTSKQRLYDDVERVVADVDAGRVDVARAFLLGQLTDDADTLDRLTRQLIVFNSEHAAAAAREIAAERRRASLLALGIDAASVLLGIVLLAAAVRAARLYHCAIEERRRHAEERASELDHFAERVAHDLKGPLASVLLGTSIAAEHPSEMPRVLEKVQRASRLMAEMIDALLAVARVEPERNHTTAVAPVISVLVDELRPAAEAAQATLLVDPLPAGAVVACSSGVLASVVSNLLHNAVKYIGGAAGERRIGVRVLERVTCVRIEIDDTGPGVPAHLGSRVFERYVRGERSTGLGLGLATVKHLVESSGGRLGVESAAGKGSCFWVELPHAPPTGDGRSAAGGQRSRSTV